MMSQPRSQSPFAFRATGRIRRTDSHAGRLPLVGRGTVLPDGTEIGFGARRPTTSLPRSSVLLPRAGDAGRAGGVDDAVNIGLSGPGGSMEAGAGDDAGRGRRAAAARAYSSTTRTRPRRENWRR